MYCLLFAIRHKKNCYEHSLRNTHSRCIMAVLTADYQSIGVTPPLMHNTHAQQPFFGHSRVRMFY